MRLTKLELECLKRWTKVSPRTNLWRTELVIDHQSFEVFCNTSKKCADWHARQLAIALARLLSRSDSDWDEDVEWTEATAAAEAWCQNKDPKNPEKRDRMIYCYRAGYLKAKRGH